MTTLISRTSVRTAAALWAIAGLVYLTGEAIAASAFPHYSYATNYISDLGVPDVGTFQDRIIDSPLAWVMNTAFLTQGVLFLLAAIAITRAIRGGPRRSFVALAAIHAVGIILVGLFHGSQANSDNGLLVLHAVGAVLAIIAGNLAAITGGFRIGRVVAPVWYRVVSVALGVIGIGSFIMLLVDTMSATVNVFAPGIWERTSVYTIIGWEIMTAIVVAVRLRRGNRELG
ncbi:MAG TPA: DUF998 domain-containing protein [Pseudolysinimonas sp.]|nr:DUF998 domain-containing protein [Pseudolysinimonas sp.]